MNSLSLKNSEKQQEKPTISATNQFSSQLYKPYKQPEIEIENLNSVETQILPLQSGNILKDSKSTVQLEICNLSSSNLQSSSHKFGYNNPLSMEHQKVLTSNSHFKTNFPLSIPLLSMPTFNNSILSHTTGDIDKQSLSSSSMLINSNDQSGKNDTGTNITPEGSDVFDKRIDTNERSPMSSTVNINIETSQDSSVRRYAIYLLIVFALRNWATTGLIFLTLCWLKQIINQEDLRKINQVEIQLLTASAPIKFKDLNYK